MCSTGFSQTSCAKCKRESQADGLCTAMSQSGGVQIDLTPSTQAVAELLVNMCHLPWPTTDRDRLV
jgi:hypothetical protein